MPRHRDLFLVRKKHTWAICYKATGRLGETRIIAWLQQADDQFFCEVNTEDQLALLPNTESKNFFGDQFTFSVDETDASGKTIRRLAGASDIRAAKAAFHAYVAGLPPARYTVLRQSGRILLKGRDQKVED